MSGVKPPQDFEQMIRDLQKRVARLERKTQPSIFDPVAENEVGAVGIRYCPDHENAVIVGVGSGGSLGPVLSCGCGGVPPHEHPPTGTPTFCGATLGLSYIENYVDGADDPTGPYINTGVLRYEGDPWETGSSAVVTEGNAYDFVIYDDWGLPADPGANVVISWVVTTEASSSGTLDVSNSVVGEPLLPLPPLSVTGAGEIVFPATGLTYDDVRGGNVRLRMVVDSGSVELSQVRLRVWDEFGIAGEWVETPSFEIETPIGSMKKAIVNSFITGTSSGWSADEAQAVTILNGKINDLRTPDPPYNAGGDNNQVFYAFMGSDYPNHPVAEGGARGDKYDVPANLMQFEIGVTPLYLYPPSPETVDYYRTDPADAGTDTTPKPHPDKVHDEPGARVRAVGGGELAFEQSGWSGIEVTIEFKTSMSGGEFVPLYGLYVVEAGLVPLSSEAALAGGYVNGVLPLPEPEDRELVYTGHPPAAGYTTVLDGAEPGTYITIGTFPITVTGEGLLCIYAQPPMLADPTTDQYPLAGSSIRARITSGSVVRTAPAGERWVCATD